MAALLRGAKIGSGIATMRRCTPFSTSTLIWPMRRAMPLWRDRDIVDAAEGLDTLLEICAPACRTSKAPTVYRRCADFIAQNGNVSPEEMHFSSAWANRWPLTA